MFSSLQVRVGKCDICITYLKLENILNLVEFLLISTGPALKLAIDDLG